ncbi:MAG: hypothetical protein HKN23_16800 [Verrucomicrobiales bacterium]|nr:hypothetical protein [Verrucomicrobiales bacterium]
MWKLILFTFGGAILGSIAGYFLFQYLAGRGLVGYAIPGAMVAVGAGINPRIPYPWIPIVCTILSFLTGAFTLWKAHPFSFHFLEDVARFFDRNPAAIALTLLAAAVTFWITWRRYRNFATATAGAGKAEDS